MIYCVFKYLFCIYIFFILGENNTIMFWEIIPAILSLQIYSNFLFIFSVLLKSFGFNSLFWWMWFCLFNICSIMSLSDLFSRLLSLVCYIFNSYLLHNTSIYVTNLTKMLSLWDWQKTGICFVHTIYSHHLNCLCFSL